MSERMPSTKVAWRADEWCRDTGIGMTHLYKMLNEGRVKSVKMGRMRLIVTAPADFIRSLETEES
jgi:hypothetical protein